MLKWLLECGLHVLGVRQRRGRVRRAVRAVRHGYLRRHPVGLLVQRSVHSELRQRPSRFGRGRDGDPTPCPIATDVYFTTTSVVTSAPSVLSGSFPPQPLSLIGFLGSGRGSTPP